MVLWSSEGLRARDGGDMEQMVEWWLKLTRVETPPDVNSKVARLDNWHFSSLDNAKRNTCLEFSNTVPAHMPCFRCDGQVESRFARSRKPPGLDQFRVIGLNFIGCITASKTQKMVQELCWTKMLIFWDEQNLRSWFKTKTLTLARQRTKIVNFQKKPLY